MWISPRLVPTCTDQMKTVSSRKRRSIPGWPGFPRLCCIPVPWGGESTRLGLLDVPIECQSSMYESAVSIIWRPKRMLSECTLSQSSWEMLGSPQHVGSCLLRTGVPPPGFGMCLRIDHVLQFGPPVMMATLPSRQAWHSDE